MTFRDTIPLFAFLVLIVSFAQAFADPTDADTGSATSQVQSPDENGRPFPSDRPGKADGPYTVEQGRFEMETDFIDASYDHYASSPVTTQSFLVVDPRFKYGLTDNVDVEIQLGGYQRVDFHDRANGTSSHAYGWSNDSLRTKYNFAGNDGSAFSGAFVAFFKLPDAEQSLRRLGVANNSIEGGIEAPLTYNLPDNIVVGFQTGVSAIRNTDDLNYHTAFINIPSVQVGVPWVEKLTAAVEIYTSVNSLKDVDDPNIYTLDPSLQYQLTKDIGFDVQADFGLNRDSPDLEMDFGVAWVF